MCSDPINRNEPEECCGRPDHLKNKYCYEIKIPEDDAFYRNHNVRCQDFVRAFPGVKPNCKLGKFKDHVRRSHKIECFFNFLIFYLYEFIRSENPVQFTHSGDRR